MFKLIENKRIENYTVLKYKSDWYSLSIKEFDNNSKIYNINKNESSNDVYLPQLYIKFDVYTNEFRDITIETKSCGCVTLEGLDEIIKGYVIAKCEAVSLKEFINNLNKSNN